jgi:hypothetical protein
MHPYLKAEEQDFVISSVIAAVSRING